MVERRPLYRPHRTRRVLGANERVGLGFIGFGLIGKRHVLDFKDQPDAQVVGIAEVHSGRRDEGGCACRRLGPRVSPIFALCSMIATSTP